MSPSELIRLVKLKKAAELIQDGRYRIGEICEMIGISSPSYFSKLFFKQFDITPKAFEKQCRKRGGIWLKIMSRVRCGFAPKLRGLIPISFEKSREK